MTLTLSTHYHTLTNTLVHIPEYAKACMCAFGETTEAKALASLKVSQDKSKVLHGHSFPRSEPMNERSGHMKRIQAKNVYF